jgi:hypothetical protein
MSEHTVCQHEDRWEAIKTQMTRIEQQTTKTNGSVGQLKMALILVGGIFIGASLVAGVKISTVGDAAELALSVATTAAKAVVP